MPPRVRRFINKKRSIEIQQGRVEEEEVNVSPVRVSLRDIMIDVTRENAKAGVGVNRVNPAFSMEDNKFLREWREMSCNTSFSSNSINFKSIKDLENASVNFQHDFDIEQFRICKLKAILNFSKMASRYLVVAINYMGEDQDLPPILFNFLRDITGCDDVENLLVTKGSDYVLSKVVSNFDNIMNWVFIVGKKGKKQGNLAELLQETSSYRKLQYPMSGSVLFRIGNNQYDFNMLLQVAKFDITKESQFSLMDLWQKFLSAFKTSFHSGKNTLNK